MRKELLNKLLSLGVNLEVFDGSLKVDAPKGTLNQDLLSEIKENKEFLIKILSSREEIPIIKKQDSYAITSSQNRLWVLSQTSAGSLAYNIPIAIKLKGIIDSASLNKSFNYLIQRHESLRTSFKMNDEGVVNQYITDSDKIDFVLEQIDITDKRDLDELIDNHIHKKNKEVFNLECAPLLKTTLIKKQEDEWILVVVFHHIISDGWSLRVFISELIEVYNGLTQGKVPELSELKIQFKDYASLVTDKSQVEDQENSKKYWLNQLSGSLPILELPITKTRPAIKTYNGTSISYSYPKEFLNTLKVFCRYKRTTLFTILLTGIKILLRRYSGQSNIIIGTPVAGRDLLNLENQIGLYVNTLAIRTNVIDNKTFEEALLIEKNTLQEAYKNQHYSFNDLLNEIEIKNNPSRSALFDVIVVLQNQTQLKNNATNSNVLDLEVEHYEIKNATSKVDIRFSFLENEEGLLLDIEYNTDIYEKPFINRIFKHFQNILISGIKDVNTTIGELSYLTAGEEQELLYGFNDTDTDYPKDKDLVYLFKEQVLKSPNSIALIYEDKEFTYSELDVLSSRFSNYLQNKYDIEQGDYIGIRLSKSEWSIICILGVLYSGCVYVPIDVNYPEERIAYMEVDSGCKVTITQEIIKDFLADKERFSKEIELGSLPSESLVYIMYTSGSTGAPKGVKVSHDNIISLVKNSGYYDFSSSDILLSTGSYSFDATTFEYWGMLLNGGKLIISSRSTLLDESVLLSVVKKHKVNVMWLTSGYANHLIQESIALFSGLSTVLIGGDVLSHKHIKMIREAYPSLVIINGYGPTENTTFSLTYRIEDEVLPSIPIGKPLNNRQVYILNESHQLQGKGIIGELYLGGRGLSQGYLNNEELTSAQFIVHPYIEGKTLYKTGDLGLWDEEGNVHYLGRKDTQVKLRGYRIELGEIERSLQSHKDVLDAVVLLRTDPSSEKELVCYVQNAGVINIKALRGYLLSELPYYMVPNYFIPVSEFPLTPNGKVDKKALLKIELTEAFLGQEYIAPRNEVEKRLVSIWEEILSIERVGIEDDFFELGGHSIKATRLLNIYRREFGVQLNLEQLFHHTDLQSHVLLLSGSKLEAQEAIPVLDKMERYVVSSGQSRLWTLSQTKEGSLSYNMPFREQLEGAYDVNNLEESILGVISRHEVLRTVFKEESGVLYQYVLEDTSFNLRYEDYRDLSNPSAEVSQYISIDNTKEFDLTNGPLLRGCLFRTGATSYELYYNLHHIISDGWSMELLIKEVLLNYSSLSEGKEIVLPALGIHYKDYSSWQQSGLLSKSYLESKEYWHGVLSGSLPVLDLPSSKLRPTIKSYEGAYLRLNFSLAEAGSIRGISKDLGGSLYMVLQSLVTLILHKYSGEKEIVLGSVVSGRDHPDLMDQIGFYVNTLVYRNKVSESESYRLYYEGLKEKITESYGHQMYPFDSLLEDLDVSHDPSRNALFDVMMVLHNSGMELEQGSSLESELSGVIELGSRLSKFDIEFVFQELGNGGLVLDLIYNSEIYDSWLMKSMLLHMQVLSNSIASSYDTTVGELSYLTAGEEQELLYGFNDTDTNYPKDKDLVYLFKEQVLKSPNSIALIYEAKEFTYSELDELSNRFSNYLLTHKSISSGMRIGIELKRAHWFPICMLGVLKLDCIYVPIDIDFPEERKQYILEDASCVFNIKEKDIEGFTSDVNLYNKTIKVSSKTSELAYIMYTSGSTGYPKGVMINHQSIIRLVKNTNYIEVDKSDNFLSVSNFTFDGSTFDIYMPFLNGATLVISDKNIFLDLESLDKLIASREISSFFITTVLFNTLVDSGIKSLKKVKYLLFGGEQVSLPHVKQFKETYPEVNLHHVYGPTENTTFSTYYEVKEVLDDQYTIPIGFPISNSTSYILDSRNNLVAIGVVGEICLGGDGLSEGYINLIEKTRSCFVSHPFISNGFIYKTGDLGKRLPSGAIEFVGRKDNQVKIRGHRVELGEVEKALLRIETIDEVVVVLEGVSAEEKKIVAYIKSSKEQRASDLRSLLKTMLSVYMLPSKYIQVTSFPITSNGKVDKNKLKNIKGILLEGDQEYVAPRNEVERKLAAIWEEILSIDRVGVEDDFFELGGHSIKATRLLNIYRREFGVQLNLEQLFHHTNLQSHVVLLSVSEKEEQEAISVLEKSDRYVVSSGQSRLWTLSQTKEGSLSYNMPFREQLEGSYDVNNLELSILRVISRHEILRTVFKEEEGILYQYILDSIPFNLGYEDYRDSSNPSAEVSRYISIDNTKEFDLTNGPLLRGCLFRTGATSYELYYNLHHIISDGWSMELLIKEVLLNYSSLSEGKEIVLPDLGIHYKDYSSWQQSGLLSKSYLESKEYWHGVLSGSLPVLDLPSSKLRPTIKSYEGEHLRLNFSLAEAGSIRGISKDLGGSLYMVLQSLVTLILHKYSGEKEIVLGSVVSGRDHPDLMDQIGFYVNTLVYRNKVSESESYRLYYEGLKEKITESYRHQMYPFDSLLEDLDVSHDPSRNALFDVMMVLHNSGMELEQGSSLESELSGVIELGSRLSKFDIEFVFQELGNGGLVLDLIYNSEIYDSWLMKSMLLHMQVLSNSIASSYDTTVGELSYLTAGEEQELLYGFNDTDTNYPKDKDLVYLFKEQVLKSPNSIALIYEAKEFTYSELDELSNRFSNYLLTHKSISSGMRIGIELKRAHWFPICMLGVLKLDCIYVPIDIDFPEERKQYILEDASCVFNIKEKDIEGFTSDVNLYNKTIKVSSKTSELAYIMYTSGSTGYPKGVMINHQSIIRLVKNTNYIEVDKSDNFLSVSNFTFDGSTFDIYMPFLNGATLVISDKNIFLDLESLDKLIASREISSFFITTVLFNTLVDSGIKSLKKVKYLLFGGEQVSLPHVKQFKETYPEVNLHHVYGPTENTTFSTYYEVKEVLDDQYTIPIGFPISNSTSYILDSRNNLVAIGVVGEICLGGDGLSEGYINLIEKTRSCFVSHPFISNGFIYKTGDLGKRLPSGAIEFVGRKDNQVKIRGHRVELGEVEKALLRIETIDEVVVVLEGVSAEEKKIVAYIKSSKEQRASDLRSLLKTMLSVYMLPSKYIQVTSFPITSNGKVDKNKLKNIKGILLEGDQEYVAPRNEVERKLAAIWEEILSIDRVGVEDDFFELGGHSIKATKVLSSINKQFNINITIKDLFEATTIEKLSLVILYTKNHEKIECQKETLKEIKL